MAKLTFSAKLENLESMLDFIKKGIEDLDFDKKDINQIQIASEEVLVNVINYAYPNETGNIDISYSVENNFEEGKKLIIKITDWGMAFNPLSQPDPDIDAPLEEREIGGLGIYMMRKIMDEIYYERSRSQNILTLVKY